MKDLNKIFLGEETATKLNNFKERLLDIEKKHIEYFKSRATKNKHSEFDRLHNHYNLIINDPRQIKFGFKKESDLDNSIQQECISLARKFSFKSL